MRHARRNQRLSRPSEHRAALLRSLAKSVVVHGSITTTLARAKEAQRLVDRLVSFGKEGSIHARRQAFRVLQDRTLVKQLFADVAPRFVDVPGGYTRVVRTSIRRGDGAQQAVLALSRLPAVGPAPAGPKPAAPPRTTPEPTRPAADRPAEPRQPKGFFEGLRNLWGRKKGHGKTDA